MSAFVRAFASRRVALMLPLALASALPNTLTQSTLVAWMSTLNIDLKTIGYFALVGLTYNLKFIWAPLIDRYPLPFLGRRRGWMLVFQLVALACLYALAGQDPEARPGLVAALAVAIGFVGASYDVAFDAYRTDVLPPEERGSGTAMYVAGYRAAILLAGSGALILATFVSWRIIYALLSSLLLLGVAATLAAPEPKEAIAAPRTLALAVVEPFREFFRRRGSLIVLAFVMLYTLGDMVFFQMLVPFLYRTVKFTTAEIGTINKITIAVATVAGATVGGGLIVKLGMRRSLYLFGAAAGGANLLYLLLVYFGKSYLLLVVALGGDSFSSGLRAAAFNAFAMALCDKRYSATQFALLSSAMTIIGRLFAASSGVIVERFGWTIFFSVTASAAIPALLLLAAIPREVTSRGDGESAAAR